MSFLRAKLWLLLGIFVQKKYLRQISISGTTEWKIRKNRHFSHVNMKGKIQKKKFPWKLFAEIRFLFFTHWSLKWRFFSKNFGTKIVKKSHSGSATIWKKNTHFLASYCCYHYILTYYTSIYYIRNRLLLSLTLCYTSSIYLTP